MDTTRRTLIKGGAAAAALALPGSLALASPADARPRVAVALRTDPFTLGVASGDPAPDGFVIWTRLAVDPLVDSGLGGMPDADYRVRWQIATDPGFRKIVRGGDALARASAAHSVHVEVRDLAPGREYWYRFRCQRWVSREGRALTAPPPWVMPSSLAMSFVSCSQYEHGFFTAYRRLAEDRPELVLHLGDYQYEYKAGDYVAPSGNVRDHRGPETTDLATYRQRQAQYKTDPDLQEAHAVAPWLVVFDDHEVDNNWADEVPEKAEDGFLQRRADAFQAYYENMPLRRASIPTAAGIQIYRRLRWGRLAAFHMLDTRQYRDDQAYGDGYDPVGPVSTDPARSIMGLEQEAWLADGFERSKARWDLLGQQVFFARRDSTATDDVTVSMDAWDGYSASRDRVVKSWLDAGVRNPVVLTGDVHAHWASDVTADFDDPDSPVVGSELVCSSITSGGDGADSGTTAHPWLAYNPQLKFQNNLRGYVNTTITPESLSADFRCLPKVSVAGAEAFTRATFELGDRERGLQLTYDVPPTPAAAARQAPTGRDTVRWETARP